jgi:hypothetical protein
MGWGAHEQSTESGRRDSNPRRQPWQFGRDPFQPVPSRYESLEKRYQACVGRPSRYDQVVLQVVLGEREHHLVARPAHCNPRPATSFALGCALRKFFAGTAVFFRSFWPARNYWRTQTDALSAGQPVVHGGLLDLSGYFVALRAWASVAILAIVAASCRSENEQQPHV